MKVIKLSEIPSIPSSAGTIGGDLYIKTLVDESTGAKDFKVAIATFPRGVRSKVHIHDFDQVHLVLSGRGIIADEKQEVIFTEGMLAFIPAGERHWHGATEDSEFTHLSIMGAKALERKL
ncbi:MAG: cupin domain-containing protein [Nitrososphaerota archaeon]